VTGVDLLEEWLREQGVKQFVRLPPAPGGDMEYILLTHSRMLGIKNNGEVVLGIRGKPVGRLSDPKFFEWLKRSML
jgi:hypothetical protein